MAMLADPRRKNKWILNPRSNQWSDDGSKFGQRLLEKMGWKAGNGLGANQQGSTEHVKVTVRHDNRGVGFKDRPEDVLQHQEDFAELLQQLGSGESDNQPVPVESKAAEKSLEIKSRNSRARVHYHKFTRGKDLSRYSASDLACILGKKPAPAPVIVESNDVGLESDVVTVDRGNMVDYFKEKKQKLKLGQSWLKVTETENCEDDEMAMRPSFGFGFNPASAVDTAEPGSEQGRETATGEKKKKTRRDKSEASSVDVILEDTETTATADEIDIAKSTTGKRRKSKSSPEFEEDSSGITVDDEAVLVSTKNICKKEKKEKRKTRLNEDDLIKTVEEKTEHDAHESIEANEKKKKLTYKVDSSATADHQEMCADGNEVPIQELDEPLKKEKKKKSKKTCLEEEPDCCKKDAVQDVEGEFKEKKKKKSKKIENIEVVVEVESDEGKKWKSKHNKGNDTTDDVAAIEGEVEAFAIVTKSKKKQKMKTNEATDTISCKEDILQGSQTTDDVAAVEGEVKASTSVTSSKKKKKTKTNEATDTLCLTDDNVQVNSQDTHETTIESENTTCCNADSSEITAGKKSKKRKHNEDPEPVKKRRKSVTFSEELFEVVLIPPREDLSVEEGKDEHEGDKEEEEVDEGKPSKVKAEIDVVKIVNGERYVNGIREIQERRKRIRIEKTNSAKTIGFHVQAEDVFDTFPGSNVHLFGYAGLNRSRSDCMKTINGDQI